MSIRPFRIRVPDLDLADLGPEVHFVHIRGRGPNPTPLLLHGFPDSFFRYHKVIDRLTDPARFGGDHGLVRGFHVTDVGYPDQTTDFSVLTPAELEMAQWVQRWFTGSIATTMLSYQTYGSAAQTGGAAGKPAVPPAASNCCATRIFRGEDTSWREKSPTSTARTCGGFWAT